MGEGYAGFPIGEGLPLAPGGVLGDAPAFFLGKAAHDGDEKLALGVQRPDVFLLEINLHALVLQLPDRCQGIDRVAGKAANGLCDDEVDFPRQRVLDHAVETVAVLCVRRRDTLIRIHPHELPIAPAGDVVPVVVHLGFIAGLLFLLIRGDPRVARDLPFCRRIDRSGCKPVQRGGNLRYSLCHVFTVPSLNSNLMPSLETTACRTFSTKAGS